MRKASPILASILGLLVVPAALHAQSAISDDMVKLGVLTDMSSLYSDATGQGSLVAAQMAIADFGGKVLGKTAAVIFADHQNKPDVGASLARQWIDQERVDALVDLPTSSVALGVQQIAKEKNRVTLISGGGTSDLTGRACSPTGVHWTYDTYALSHVAAQAIVQRGGDTWFFITADYAFGHALERDASEEVKRSGGKVLGTVRAPFNASDFSSFLLQAQASKAKIIALANSGGDTITAVKQAAEFGLTATQKMALLRVDPTDIHGIGLPTAQGMMGADGFYWDKDDDTRAFSARFYAQVKRMPTMIQAGVYSAVTHYLKAVQAAGTDEAKAVVAKMRELPINDFFAKNGKLREDGRMVHDMYLVQAKTPAESNGEWDLYKILATVPGDQAFRPLNEGGCPFLIKK
jgi:branched-chain amino acid transport system substrate-binding protein